MSRQQDMQSIVDSIRILGKEAAELYGGTSVTFSFHSDYVFVYIDGAPDSGRERHLIRGYDVTVLGADHG